MEYKNIIETIEECLSNITFDLSSLKYVTSLDFVDIFPKSDEHKELLDKEALKIAKVIESTNRGNFYLFNTPLKTKYGDLKIFKIRKYDETRLNYPAAPDFNMTDYNTFLKYYINDDRFTYIKRPTYCGLEFKTKDSLIYFLDVPTTTYFNIK